MGHVGGPELKDGVLAVVSGMWRTVGREGEVCGAATELVVCSLRLLDLDAEVIKLRDVLISRWIRWSFPRLSEESRAMPRQISAVANHNTSEPVLQLALRAFNHFSSFLRRCIPSYIIGNDTRNHVHAHSRALHHQAAMAAEDAEACGAMVREQRWVQEARVEVLKCCDCFVQSHV